MTGALEVGAKFALNGIRALVHTQKSDAPVQVIDTETRHLSPSDAFARLRSLAIAEADFIYKKTDSTLRGNIGAELRALAASYPAWTIGYAGAYPALGRTVRNGLLLVDGVPVHQTVFSTDALNPVTTSAIREVIGDQLPCTIFDSESDADIETAANALLSSPSMRIAAGPAAFAEALARKFDLPREQRQPWPALPQCVIVNGSRHPASAAQIAYAIAHGGASRAANAKWRIIERGSVPDADNVIVFGGDTAFDMFRALGSLPLEPLGEPLPGVVVSRHENKVFITKAGGFGAPDLLCTLRRLLDGGSE